MFLLDTDIIIYSWKNKKNVIDNFKLHKNDPKAISVISYGELIHGAQKSQQKNKNLAKVHRLAEIFPVINITKSIMDTYGLLIADLQKKGKSLDKFDAVIAATAITNGYCLVTNNVKHFKKIPGLKIVNWNS
ncbi:type II toxin-antitoxin system VapC family toxin [bacterium]|nr:type II toxin-antitoxin system VapC family toxin [bacterium]